MRARSEWRCGAYRGRGLAARAVAAVLLALTVWIAMRMSVLAHRRATHVAIDADSASPPRTGVARETARRTVRVLLPMALTTLLVLAVLRLCGVELTLFHLFALILAAGLGLDYALFFDHDGAHPAHQPRPPPPLTPCPIDRKRA